MPTLSLAFTPLPAQVRTARMFAVAVGRRSGLPEELLDEVRLAVGEACSRAVAVHRRLGSPERIRLSVTEDERGYAVAVRDAGDASQVEHADLDALAIDEEAGGALPPGLDLAVVAGLVDELTVRPDPAGGTIVRLRWKR